jgi:hypothetical protein
MNSSVNNSVYVSRAINFLRLFKSNELGQNYTLFATC